MSPGNRQIFQTNTPSRWKKFKWGARVFFAIAIFGIVILVLALIRGYNPSLPALEVKSKIFAAKLDPSNPFTFTSTQNKKYKGFKNFLENRYKKHKDKIRPVKFKQGSFVRAAYYTPWDNNGASITSLEQHAEKLNTVFPEWFFIDSNDHSKLQSRMDSASLFVMRRNGLRILPILSNFNSKKKVTDFDGSLLHSILGNPEVQKKFIKQLTDTLLQYRLQGINIDFEEIPQTAREQLVTFMEALYKSLHSRGLLLTMDIAPRDDSYDLRRLAAWNDYIIVMAYDQHYDKSRPGPICDQKWIEEMLDQTAKKVDPSKIILGIAGYGYDWSRDEDGKMHGESISYPDAINRAKIANATIDFDNDNYNLHYKYTTENESDSEEKTEHEVWFTDAATIYNVMRFSDDYTTAGTALWRLGSEDRRLWKFYNLDLSSNTLSKHPFNYNLLDTIPVADNDVSYQGEGEVLNIVYTPHPGKIKITVDTTEQLIAEQEYEQIPSGFVIEKFAEDTSKPGPGHKLILTFDDGPDSRWTPRILDILQKEKVPAAFFVVGIQAEKNIPLIQRIFSSGYEIGNHTFTHGNIAKMTPGRAALEMKLTRLLIESVTGHSTILFRAPYNADSEPHTYEELEPIARSREQNYITIGESIDPMDWEPGVNADTIVSRTIQSVEERGASIILLHDAGGETREETIKALPRIINYFKSRGYRFTSIAGLMGKTRDDVMPAMPPSKDAWLINLNFFLAEATYWAGQLIFSLFLVGIALSVGRIIIVGTIAYIQKKKEKQTSQSINFLKNVAPAVSVIVPAFNEEVNVVRTVNSLLNQDYPELEIIFVDDGSTDNTFKKVSAAFADNPKVTVLTKANGGKASALNYGIKHSGSSFVVCIDADTQLKKDAVSQLIKKFYSDGKPDEATGAVAGNVKVGNEVNMITRWQSIEYITSQNFDRRAFDLFNCIIVVPGAIGAFRKQAVMDAGMFTTDTLAEDCDLTMRLLKGGYKIRNCTEAISYTEAPETLRGFLKQRFRWSFGVMQTFWKHRDACFNTKYRALGTIALPNILIYQIILPFLAPVADLVLVASLIAAGMHILPVDIGSILLYYCIFMVVDIASAAVAFLFEKESYLKLIWMIPQRLVYRQLMYYVLLKSVVKAIKGELQGWGKLKRTGNLSKAVSTI